MSALFMFVDCSKDHLKYVGFVKEFAVNTSLPGVPDDILLVMEFRSLLGEVTFVHDVVVGSVSRNIADHLDCGATHGEITIRSNAKSCWIQRHLARGGVPETSWKSPLITTLHIIFAP